MIGGIVAYPALFMWAPRVIEKADTLRYPPLPQTREHPGVPHSRRGYRERRLTPPSTRDSSLFLWRGSSRASRGGDRDVTRRSCPPGSHASPTRSTLHSAGSPLAPPSPSGGRGVSPSHTREDSGGSPSPLSGAPSLYGVLSEKSDTGGRGDILPGGRAAPVPPAPVVRRVAYTRVHTRG